MPSRWFFSTFLISTHYAGNYNTYYYLELKNNRYFILSKLKNYLP